MTNPIIPNPVFETLPPPWQLVILDAWTASVNAAVNQLFQDPTSFNANITSDTGQTIAAGGTQDIIFNSVNFNIGAGYDPLSGRFTAPNDGIYRFDCRLWILPVALPAQGLGWFSRNGALISSTTNVYPVFFSSFPLGSAGAFESASVTVQLVAGDTFSVKMSSPGSNSIQTGSAHYLWFSGSQVQ